MDESANEELEIGHVLFIDIVGYSKLLIEDQKERLRQLTEVVLQTPQVREATDEQLVRLPTGDGTALVFRHSAAEPARCALEIAEALKKHPEIPVRMGIHSGPVSEVTDVSGRTNIAGAGINIAQRVMDCGDAGHILLSQRVADDLSQYREWAPRLHDLGECEVKHGVRLHLVNLCTDQLGNPETPERLGSSKPTPRPAAASVSEPGPIGRTRRSVTGLVIAAVLVAGAGYYLFTHRSGSGGSGVTAIPEKSIAVMPFENLSSDKENGYFTDGVQDEILTDLAKVADLKVISRTSVMKYKATPTRNLPQIAQALRVANVLEGSVQRSGQRVRVSAQLIDARTDTHLWAENYDRDLSDVFAIQSEIAQAIADQLQAKLSPREKAALQEQPTRDLTAYELYAKAKKLRDDDTLNSSRDRANLYQGIDLLQEAIARDPHFLQAYWLLALANDALYSQYEATPERRAQADAAVQAAARLQPDAGLTHLAKGINYYLAYGDYARARGELQQAQKSLPNSSEIPGFLAFIARREGRWDEAVREMRRATELDPNGGWLSNLGEIYLNLRDYQNAARTFDRDVQLHPNQVTRLRRASVDFFAAANLASTRAIIDEVERDAPASAPDFSDQAFMLALRERDPVAAERAVAMMSGQPRQKLPFPTAFCEGGVELLRHDSAAARAAFAVAREQEAQLAKAQPNQPELLEVLSFADAWLGDKNNAIAEAKAGCAAVPLSKNAYLGAQMIRNLARVYALVGEPQLALDQLAVAAKLPAGPSYGELKLDPEWDSLRSDPRFEKTLALLGPKSIAVSSSAANQIAAPKTK